MRKIVVLSFLTLDGVVQAPGGPAEDPSGGFKHGGWTVPFFDAALGRIMGEQMSGRSDLLLGRKTFEIFASYWPQHEEEWPGINAVTKYVATNTLAAHEWKNTVFLKGDIGKAVERLKRQNGPDLQVHGSGRLVQALLEKDLVDELWLKIFPITLGAGKRLFDGGAIPARFELTGSRATPHGVIAASYARAGAVETGSFGG
jgi:dihydrofolate reductase